jgi:hypothetical protein
MFERSDAYAAQHPRISLSTSFNIATTNGAEIQLGSKTIQSGTSVVLAANASGSTAFTIDTSITSKSFKIDYSMIRNITEYRSGTLVIASANAAGTSVNYTDEYSENSNLGILLFVEQSGSTLSIKYNSTAGTFTEMRYSITYFN